MLINYYQKRKILRLENVANLSNLCRVFALLKYKRLIYTYYYDKV